MDFGKLQEVLSELTLQEQVRAAQLQKIPVPEGTLAVVEGLTMLKEFVEGSEKFPDRVYVSTKNIPIDLEKGTARGLYIEVRALDCAIRVLQTAQAEAKRQGFNTAPAPTARK